MTAIRLTRTGKRYLKTRFPWTTTDVSSTEFAGEIMFIGKASLQLRALCLCNGNTHARMALSVACGRTRYAQQALPFHDVSGPRRIARSKITLAQAFFQSPY